MATIMNLSFGPDDGGDGGSLGDVDVAQGGDYIGKRVAVEGYARCVRDTTPRLPCSIPRTPPDPWLQSGSNLRRQGIRRSVDGCRVAGSPVW